MANIDKLPLAQAPSPVEKIRQEHDYVLDKLEIVAYNGASYSLAGHHIYFTYDESIFSVPHGTIFLNDAIDYPTLLPIIGEEKIIASFTRQDETAKEDGGLLEPISFSLNVYSMGGRQQDGGSRKRQTYSLQYTSDIPFLNVTSKVNKAYKSKLYSDIVAEIIAEFLPTDKKINIEPTKYEQNYIIQNETPLGAINKISKRAVSADDSNGSFYVFYEDRDSINFVTVSSMLDKAPKTVIRYEPKHVDADGNALEHKAKDIEKDIYNVNFYHEANRFDTLDSLLAGHGASNLIAVDLIRRKVDSYDFDLNRDFDKFKHLDKSKRFTSNAKIVGKPSAAIKMILTNKDHNTVEHIAQKDPEARPSQLEDVVLLRGSQKAQILKNVITATMSGDPRVRAGDILDFRMPEHMGKTSDTYPEELDKYLQGKYLILAVSHVIKPSEYSMNLELVKDTFFSDIEHRDPIKEYEGIK